MGDYTTNINMYKPESAEIGFDDEFNDSLDGLDNLFGASGTHDHSGEVGHGATTELRQQGGTINSAQLPDSGAIATLFATTILANGNLPIRVQSDLNLYTDTKTGSFWFCRVKYLYPIDDDNIFIGDDISLYGHTATMGTLFTEHAIGLGTFHKHIFSNYGYNQESPGGQSSSVSDGDWQLGTVGPNANGEIFEIPMYHDPEYTQIVISVELWVSSGGSALIGADLEGTAHLSGVGEPPTFYTNNTHDTWKWETWNFTETDNDAGTITTLSLFGTTKDTGGTLYTRGVHIEALRIT